MLGPPLCGNSRTGGSLLADRALMSTAQLSEEEVHALARANATGARST